MSPIYSIDTDNAVSAPLPTHFSPGLHYNETNSNSSSNTSSQSEITHVFNVPDNFQTDIHLDNKGATPKSNSWFNSTAFNKPADKAIRRVASAPNANNLQRLSNSNLATSSLHCLNEKDNAKLRFERIKLCRRTYSSASIKIKRVEVDPSSFVKVRMLGKGDVGKVYMVRQKGTDKLFAMKGMHTTRCIT